MKKLQIFRQKRRRPHLFGNFYSMNASSQKNRSVNLSTQSIRQTIWNYVQQHHPCLIQVADYIAKGSAQPHAPTLGLPPLNFLVNAEPPASFPLGLAGCITSPTVTSFAAGKQSNAEGFMAQTALGLGILFGTWSDYCLYCWAKGHSVHREEFFVTLLFGRDHGAMQDILGKPRQGCAPLKPGVDWGETEVRDFYQSSDPSTVNLFTSIYRSAKPGCSRLVFGPHASPQAQADLERFISEYRLFIYNVWPWFRSGASSTDSRSIHSNLHQVSVVKRTLSDLVHALSPLKIAALGSWSYDTSAPTATHHLQNALLPTGYNGVTEVFRHPSAYGRTGWQRRWQAPFRWSADLRWGGKSNAEAFQDFIR